MPKIKLSPEEQRERKIQRRLEKKRQKIEKQRQLKRDHLGREIKYGELTLKRYESDWKKMLIKVTLPRMRQDLEFAWHNFERVIDCKDFTISLLMDELKDAEEQHMHNFRAHLENLDKLMGILDDRLDEFRRDFEFGVKQLQDKVEAEVEDIKDDTNENVNYLKTMLHQLEVARREQERTTKVVYYSRLDEADVKNNLLLQKLKGSLEHKYQNMLADMKHFFSRYNKRIKERKKEHDNLKEADEAIHVLISDQVNRMKSLYDVLRLLRQKFTDLKQTEGSELSDKQSERQFFFSSYLALKNRLAEDQQNDFNKLAHLSQCSCRTFDALEATLKKGETILKMGEVCRRLETQKEKILSFPSDTAGLSKKEKKWEDDLDTKELRRELVMFWQRVGQAFGVHYTLKREKKYLEEENGLFVELHNDYCDNLMFPQQKKYQASVGVNKIDGNLAMLHMQKAPRGRKFCIGAGHVEGTVNKVNVHFTLQKFTKF